MLKAKDIMEPIKTTLRPDHTLKDAVGMMRVASRKPGLHGVKGLLVLDEDGRLIGMVTIRDLLKAILPSYMEHTSVGEFTWPGMLEDMARRASRKTVDEIMSREVVTVSPESPLMDCAWRLLKHNLWRLPVVDEEHRPLGLVYVRDLHYAIVQAVLEEEE